MISYDYQQAVYVADVYLGNVDAKPNFYHTRFFNLDGIYWLKN